MSKAYIPVALRRKVVERAEKSCEYCRLIDLELYMSFHVEHIISEFHEGPTISENLAYACQFCNLKKGISLGSIEHYGAELVPYYNPRSEIWGQHFSLSESREINGLTPTGRVTTRALSFNDKKQVAQRKLMILMGLIKLP